MKRVVAWIVIWMISFAIEEHLFSQDIAHSFIMIYGAGILSVGIFVEETIENMKVKR